MAVVILVKGCDDDSYQGTSRDAEDVLMIVVMTLDILGNAKDAMMIVIKEQVEMQRVL